MGSFDEHTYYLRSAKISLSMIVIMYEVNTIGLKSVGGTFPEHWDLLKVGAQVEEMNKQSIR